MKGLFFTGTDTGVGKTLVTGGVARVLRSRGRSVRVCKPVATGAVWYEGRWLSEDTMRLAEAAGMEEERDRVTPWAFPVPAAPPVAARLAGASLEITDLLGAVQDCAQPGVPLLVEGVGGLLCPLTESATVADLALGVGFPLIVVARRSLGTLNHTLLTVEAAQRRGLAVAGVVVSETVPPCGPADETNVEELRQRLSRLGGVGCASLGIPLLAVVPHLPPGRDAAEALAVVDWWRLCGGEPHTSPKH
jgi:dethiobiotin synthetase